MEHHTQRNHSINGKTRRVYVNMSKPVPLRYGKYYHIFSRGINRGDIFFAKRNYIFFLKRYAQYIGPVADTYAYCLLVNHFHFLVWIKTVKEQELWFNQNVRAYDPKRVFRPKPPSQQFGILLNAYAKAINKAYGRTGSLFQHPFGRIEVTNEHHLRNLVIYIHQNPQHHGLVDDFREWPYSSYGTMLSAKPTKLHRDESLAWFGDEDSFGAMHKEIISGEYMAPLVFEDFD